MRQGTGWAKRRLGIAGLATSVTLITSALGAAPLAHADDARVDLLSITIDNPNPVFGDSCQYVNVTTAWSVQPGYDVGLAFANITNATTGQVVDNAMLPTPEAGAASASGTYFYCGALFGHGDFVVGPTNISVYSTSDYSSFSVLDSTTGTFSYMAAPAPPSAPVAPPAAQLPKATAKLVVTRTNKHAHLDVDITARVGSRPLQEQEVLLQQRASGGTWQTIRSEYTDGDGKSYISMSSATNHVYRAYVPATENYQAGASKPVTALDVGVRAATTKERTGLLHAVQGWALSHKHAYLDSKKTLVSLTVPSWAETVVHAHPVVVDGVVHKWIPAIVLLHYRAGAWRVYAGANYPDGVVSCSGIPKSVKADLSMACGEEYSRP